MVKSSEYNGVVVVDKPAGKTSHDVVNAARRLYRTKRVGHTGTLDPDATGVLVLCLGNGTRIAEYLSAARKNYITDIVFGVETDTQDASGKITAERDASALMLVTLLTLLPRFCGTIQQIPPMVSALHHEGKRLYELAREGITVERAAREITIYGLELLDFTPGTRPTAKLDVTCSTGTYIRTLAADIGEAAGTGALMQTLRRTWVGENEASAFTLREAFSLEELQTRADNGTLAETVIPLHTALRSWPTVRVDETQLGRIRNGQRIALEEFPNAATVPVEADVLTAVLGPDGDVCAITQAVDGTLRPIKVFTPT